MGKLYRIVWALVFVALSAEGAVAVTVADVAFVEDTDGSIHSSYMFGNVYMQKVACRFYQTHPDDYDVLFAFTTLNPGLMSTIEGWPVKQDQQGIGRDYTNQTRAYCSNANRLRQAVKAGFIDSFPDDPDDPDDPYFLSVLTGSEMLAHEFGHHWLASVNFDLDDGEGMQCLLRGLARDSEPGSIEDCNGHPEDDFNFHWSTNFNQGSVMYANVIEDRGDGSFVLSNPGLKYGPLDQYLMGLRSAEEVGPLFLVDPGYLTTSSSSGPVRPGTTHVIEGTRIDLTVEDVIRAEGPRVPAFDACHWKGALIIVYPAGEPPTPAEVAKVALYGDRFETFYAWATDGRGSMDLTLDNRGRGTDGCPGEASNPPPVDAGTTADADVAEPEPDSGEDTPASTDVSRPDVGAPDVARPPDGGAAADALVRDGSVIAPGGCVPGALECWRTAVRECNASGDGWLVVDECADYDMVCREGACTSLSSGGGGGCQSVPAPSGTPPALLLVLGLAVALCRWQRRHADRVTDLSAPGR